MPNSYFKFDLFDFSYLESFIQQLLTEFFYVPGTLINTGDREMVKAVSESEVFTV